MALLKTMPIIRSLTRGKSIRLLQKQSTKRNNPCVYLEAKAVEQTPATEFNSILQEIISTEYNYSVDLKKTLNVTITIANIMLVFTSL